MKKKYVIALFSFILLLIITSSVQAEFEIDAGVSYNRVNLEDFNDFLSTRGSENDARLRDLLPEEETERNSFDEIKSSLGARISGRYWFNDLIAIGGGAEAFLISTPEYDLDFDGRNVYDEDFQLGLYGALVEAKAKVLKEDNIIVNLNAGFGRYYSSLEWNRKYDGDIFGLEEDREENFAYDADSWGAKFGSELSFTVRDDISLDGTVNYRLLAIDDYTDDEGNKFFDSYNNQVMEFDFSGFELKSSISFKF